MATTKATFNVVSSALASGNATDGHVLTADGSGNAAWEEAGGGAVSAVANGADNRIATFSSSTALNGEANLTFTGTAFTAQSTGALTTVFGSLQNTANALNLTTTGGVTAGIFLAAPTADHSFGFQTGGTERMRIHSGGDFTVATTTAVGSMYNGVNGIGFGYSSGGYGAIVRGGTNTPLYVSTNSQGAGGFIEFAQSGATRGNITYTGSATSYNASSDYRLKENAVTIENALSKIDSLNPINFDWIESGDNSDGFLAHEIQEVLPYTVTGTKDEVYTDENSGEEKINGEPKYQVMDYAKLTPVLVKAIQEQQTIIENLKARIETLENA